ncbi:hypothetical protein A6779_09085 [Marinobacter adhaerens]|uniref:Glycosyl transferase n=1 Tax=Marinobacter salsuginis TaxID=418719 RepID=A0A5M3PIQ1_9GAMM|nr:MULTISPECIES: hypothetical protein [Marinobacter]ODM32273.1 hypothetical protein A6779_09085 [Marinobacter adhaerens]QTN40578.1 hypothetical protein HZ997_12800 [Marinobacter salsuginis]GBO82757.1 hypothetical protein MS5N3_02080 [Marinobacter salsuginis]
MKNLKEKHALGIVIPLKARSVSKNWTTTCQNLDATLTSIVNQTDRNFRCVVVGHDKPPFFDKASEQIEFYQFTTMPPPEVGNNESENQLKYEADRCTKILEGIVHLNNLYPITHWYALDADDLIHKDFVKSCSDLSERDGIIFDRGYFFFKNTGIINKSDSFSAYCGSSAVISSSTFDIPKSIEGQSFRATPFGDVSHVNMKKHMEKQGLSIATPEERLVMYVRDNGENISNAAYCNTWDRKLKKTIKMLIKTQGSPRKIKKDFGILG